MVGLVRIVGSSELSYAPVVTHGKGNLCVMELPCTLPGLVNIIEEADIPTVPS